MHLISGAVVNLRKATISVVMPVILSNRLSVRLSVPLCARLFVRMEQLGSHWTDFNEILYLRIFRKSTRKIEILLK
jgi:hypothetical protein